MPSSECGAGSVVVALMGVWPDAPAFCVTMLDEMDENWMVAVKVYAGNPDAALTLASQFETLKRILRRGARSIPDAIDQLEAGIECLYFHSNFDGMGKRLYRRTIQGHMTPEQDGFIEKLDKISKLKGMKKPAKKRSAKSSANKRQRKNKLRKRVKL